MKTVIIGAGPAGVTAAETLRALDRDAEIVVLTGEPYPPYSPPAMVDHFLTGSNAHLWRGDSWPEDVGVDFRSGVVVESLDPEEHNLYIAGGASLGYDRVVIATGSSLYAPVEGARLDGVYNFKSLSAAERLIGKVKSGEAHSALIVGAGFIGVEIALLLRALGVEVTMLEMLDRVMPRMLDADTAAVAVEILKERGVDLKLNTKALAFTGEKEVESVQIEGGEMLAADLYIAATGVKPNVEFLNGSGIEINWGISVDEQLKTNLPDVFAAGDVVETRDRLTGESYVHAIFPNAVEQGKVVGLNLAGHEAIYEGSDRMNSLKHLDVPIMAVGLKEGDQVLQTRWDGSLRTIYLQDNRIVGFQLVGDLQPAGVFRTLMNREEDIRRIKDRLLKRSFGQGTAVWSALTVPAG